MTYFLYFFLLYSFLDMPVVTLKMGSSLNPDDIKEGDDVYFECLIQSNPKPYKMSWYHNVRIFLQLLYLNRHASTLEFLQFRFIFFNIILCEYIYI